MPTSELHFSMGKAMGSNLSEDNSSMEKAGDVELTQTPTGSEAIGNLSPEHRDYLLKRHGTLDLDPMPDMSDADPYNWSTRKKCINLALVAFHAMMSTFSAACLQSVFVAVSQDLHISLQKTSYLVSPFIAILGGAPLFWRPIANRYGRRPVFTISLICSIVANIGAANSHTYASMSVCRALNAFFISPAAAIGSAVVAECFFKKDRARAMGIWTLLVTIGVPVSPFIFGFVALRVDYRWIFYIVAATNGVQLLLYLFLGPETRYIKGSAQERISSWKEHYLSFRRIDPTPFRWWDFVEPLSFALKPCVMLPAASYSMIFLFGNVLLAFEIPQLFPVLFHQNYQQIGLQFLSLIIGSVIGEQIGGITSDRWMLWRTKRTHQKPAPEFRLWLSYIGHLLTIAGVVVFLIQLGSLKHYNVTPVVGAAIAAGGNQIVTTVLITYAVDVYKPEAASVGVFITFVRQIWGFIGPFWIPQAIDALGFGGMAGLVTGLMVAVSILPTMLLQWQGHKMR